MQEKQKWFETWFDTSYYHILYKNRNDEEAQYFMKNLIKYLAVKEHSKVLDLACGKGRHSIFLNEQKLDVVGVDLSEQSILHAKQFENDSLHFDVHDMREVYDKQSFDYVFNLFTSFGYFEDDNENQKAVSAMEQMLNENGVLVIDFLNAVKTVNNLVLKEEKVIDGITFNITREVKNNFIVKSIQFEDKGESFSFEEKVKALKLEDFKKFFDKTKLELLDVFGNFSLEKYDPKTSDRLIMILRLPLKCA
jgi:SAM-dependent methyltransferase